MCLPLRPIGIRRMLGSDKRCDNISTYNQPRFLVKRWMLYKDAQAGFFWSYVKSNKGLRGFQ
jgi:hypothetical protein